MKNYIEKLKLEKGYGYTLSHWKSVAEFNNVRKSNKNWKVKPNVYRFTSSQLVQRLFESKLLSVGIYGFHSSYRHFDEFKKKTTGSVLESVVIDIKRDIPRINKFLDSKLEKLKKFNPNDQLRDDFEEVNIIENRTHYLIKDKKSHFGFLFTENYELQYVEYAIPVNIAVIKNKYTFPSHTCDVFHKRCDYARAIMTNFYELINNKDPKDTPVIILHGYIKVDPSKVFSERSIIDLNSLINKKDEYLMIKRPISGEKYGLIELKDLPSFFELFEGKYWRSALIEEWINKKGSGSVRRLAKTGVLKLARMPKGTSRWEIEVSEYLTYLLESNDDRNIQSLENFLDKHSSLKITDFKSR